MTFFEKSKLSDKKSAFGHEENSAMNNFKKQFVHFLNNK